MQIGIVGATGEVGRTMLKVLEESNINITSLSLFASSRSAGKEVVWKNNTYIVEELTEEAMQKKYDYLLFSAGSGISKKFAIVAEQSGNTIIDNSSAFRMEKDTLLIVPEINGDLLREYQGIIANPNCSTIQMLLALNLIQRKLGIKEVVVSTYQSVSGAGNRGIEELKQQLSGTMEKKHFAKQIAHNVLPAIGDITDNLFTTEEMKMVDETRKIFQDETINVYPTAVRVPVFYGHSESLFLRTRKDSTLEEVKSLIHNAKNVEYTEDLLTPLDIEGSNVTKVSRLRQIGSNEFLLWVVADNIRVGAATNAVRILEKHMELNASNESK